jgi:predicted DNA-binding protein (UPF0251 family)
MKAGVRMVQIWAAEAEVVPVVVVPVEKRGAVVEGEKKPMGHLGLSVGLSVGVSAGLAAAAVRTDVRVVREEPLREVRRLQVLQGGLANRRCREPLTRGAAQPARLELVRAMAAPETGIAQQRGVAEMASSVAGLEIAFYRKYTEGMLRRYMRLSMETGRVPSLLGKEMFRGRVTSYRVRSFEDVVIFVHDMEKCFAFLTDEHKQVLGRVALQEYTQSEAAGLLGVSLRTVVRRYADALDRLSVVLLDRGLLESQGDCQAWRGVR